MTLLRPWHATGPENGADGRTTLPTGEAEYERQLARLAALLQPGPQGPRLVTLIGRSETDKTHLAFDAIRQLTTVYGDAVYSVCLAQVTVPMQLPLRILDALQTQYGYDRRLFVDSGLISNGVAWNQRDLTGLCRDLEAWLEHVVRALPARPCLLMLDRFEQLLLDGQTPAVGNSLTLPDGAGIIGTLLALAPQLKCLVTSCRLLDLDGEFAFPLFCPSGPDPLDATPRSLYTRLYG